MKNFYEMLIWLENDDYKGTHTAPNKEDAPLHDLTNTYPDDIYSDKGILYYGDGSPFDGESINIIRSAKGKPNLSVKIFRAVPDANKETNKKIKYYASLIYYTNKFGFAPIASKDMFASELYAKNVTAFLAAVAKPEGFTFDLEDAIVAATLVTYQSEVRA